MLSESRVPGQPALMAHSGQAHPLSASSGILDSEESKNIAVVHKTNQGYSGMDLWKLKHFRPDLFQGAASSAASGPPAGFRDAPERPGFWFNPQSNVFMSKQDNKPFCCDPETNALCQIHQGDDISNVLVVRGDSSACVGKNGATSRHLSIGDLHRAAASMKLDMAHHDAPAAMYAVYDGTTSGSAAAEAAAKGFHVRLLPRLAAHRGLWQTNRLERVLGDTLEELLNEVSPEGVGAAVVLLLGGRIVMAATHGAACMLFGQAGSDSGDTDTLDVVGDGAKPRVECGVLEDGHVGVFMTVKGVRTGGLPMGRIRSMARSHVTNDRPRAACVYVLGEAQKGGAEGALVAAAVRLCWVSRSAPAAKKARTDPAALAKVRCRHILVRFTGAQSSSGDRKAAGAKPVKRTQAEAEVIALQMIFEVQYGGTAAFTKRCREDSECETAMRGGDLAGDLGWLDRDPKKNKAKVPAAVVRAAFALQVGQVSDIVVSERGVHVITRTA